jgi:phospholipid/cholesterol/gamma-HCH transport system ATP-binding protein
MAIEFVDVVKTFGDRTVLSGITMRVERGEILMVVGTSGVGKSVTIKHIIGLLRPTSGEIRVDGRLVNDLTEKEFFQIRRQVAMVFQASSLFDSLDVLQNVMLPLRKVAKMSEKAARPRALELLEEVGMTDWAHAFPAELGDGMKKRVAIARALTLKPAYVLFDEPTTGLDPVSARRVDRLIASLAAHHEVGCIVVSHDLQSIFSIGQRIAMVYQGRIYLEGPADLFTTSQDPIIRQFFSGSSTGPMETPGF